MHVGADEECTARLRSLEHGQDACTGDLFVDGEAEGTHACCQRGSPHLFESELRVLLRLSSECDHPWCQLLDILTEIHDHRHPCRRLGSGTIGDCKIRVTQIVLWCVSVRLGRLKR